MNLGYFTFPIHDKKKNYLDSLKEDIDGIVIAEKVGFKEAFVGEHVTDEYEKITSSIVFISNLLSQTNKIKLGTGTINLPNHHPVSIASSISMLDHLAKGRLIMGIGPGSLLSDSEAFETLDKNRNEMFLESINTIKKVWKQKPPYNIKGKYWNVSTKKTYDKSIAIGVIPRPYQKPHPEIVCTSLSRNTKSIKALTDNNWGLISSNFLYPESLKFHQLGINLSKNKKNTNWRLARKIFVNPSKKVIKDYVFSSKSPYRMTINQIFKKLKRYNRLDVMKKNPDDKNEKISVDNLLKELVITGSPKEVAEKILKLKEDIGNFKTITYVGIDWLDKELAKKSIKLMGEKVINYLN